MSVVNQTPQRPYVEISQIDRYGEYVDGRKNIYKIPYNYISNFSITFGSGKVGNVKLTVFDHDYDWILNGLLKQVYDNKGKPEINFMVKFGWEGQSIIDTIKNILNPSGENMFSYDSSYINTLTGKREVGKRLRDKYSRLVSDPLLVTFTKINYGLTEMGLEIELSGMNMTSGTLALFSNIDKSYIGTPITVIKDICVDNDIDVTFANLKYDKPTELRYTAKNPFQTNNKMLGNIIKELVERIDVDEKLGQVDFLLDNIGDVGKRVISKIIVYNKPQSLDRSNFLGKYNYFSGKNSNIVSNLNFEIPNLIRFLGSNIKSKSLDSSSKKQTEAQAITKYEKDIKKSKTVAEKEKASQGLIDYYNTNPKVRIDPDESSKSNNPSKSTMARKFSSAQKGVETTEDFANYVNYFETQLNDFVIKGSMTVLGDPTLDFNDLEGQSFLELNIHTKEGKVIDYLSGIYRITEITHKINDTDFVTDLSIAKWKFVYDEENKPNKEKKNSGVTGSW